MEESTRRILRQRLESLQACGVQWLPKPPAPLPEPRPMPPNDAKRALNEPTISPPGIEMPAHERRIQLNLLAERVKACTRCDELVRTRTQTVFGVGAVLPELCFVGEAPGADEDRQGEPFVGAAGQLLNKIIAACGMSREEVYICNILRCRPPGNRQPLPDEAAHCREFLERTLELVQPKYICALGAIAAQNLLQTTTSIGQLRGVFQSYRGIPVLCTYHPAYLLRNANKKRDVWEDMKLLLRTMGRPIPETKAGGPA